MKLRVLIAAFATWLIGASAAMAQGDAPESAPDEISQADMPAVPNLSAPLELVDEAVQDNALEAVEDETDGLEITPVVIAPGNFDALFGEAQFAYATEDYEVAMLHAETAAAGGHVQAATLAGLIHVEGHLPRSNTSAALTWFRRAAEHDEPVALYQIGLMAQAGRENLNPATAGGYFLRAARSGHVPSMLAYALALKAGDIPQNAPDAMDWAERAASEGNVEAMYQRALMGADWQHGPNDLADARYWFERAGRADHAEAALQAGLMAATGEGGEIDAETALQFVRRSAETGYPPAQGQYGLMLYQGWNGAEPDLTQAAHWFLQGAEGGDAESEFLYAYVLARGEGVPQDLEAAYRWAIRAQTDFDGSVAENPERDQLQAGLENILPGDVTARLRRAVAAEG